MKKITLTIAALAAFAFTASAQFVVGPELKQLSQVPATVAASTTVATNSTALNLTRNQGASFTCSLTATNVDPSLVTFYLAVSHDGTNYTTTNNAHRVLVPVVVNPASSPVIYTTNFAADTLNNVKSIRIMGIGNGVTNTLTINSVYLDTFR